jgi:hypothetical protein
LLGLEVVVLVLLALLVPLLGGISPLGATVRWYQLVIVLIYVDSP